MSDTIERTECSKCGWVRGETPPTPKPSSCDGPLVQRTYVAVEHLQTLAAMLVGEIPSPEKLAAAQRIIAHEAAA